MIIVLACPFLLTSHGATACETHAAVIFPVATDGVETRCPLLPGFVI